MTVESQHILVLSDDSTRREAVTARLTRAGFRIATMAESADALLLAKDQRFDLVIADYCLPDSPGADFVRLLRDCDGHEQIPAILLAGSVSELDPKHLPKELPVLLLARPHHMEQLAEAVSKCLAKKVAENATSEQKRILVADDSRSTLTVIRFVLGKAGYHVTTAVNGREAWNQLERNAFDLLLTDYEMPEMDAEMLCRRIKKTARLKDLPIIILSGKTEAERQGLREELNVNEILFKPFSPRALTAMVDACLAQPEACLV